MGWADHAKAELREGRTVQVRPRGHSMAPLVNSGDLCTLSPVQEGDVEKGSIVLVRCKGKDYLHLVKAVQGRRFQIGNNRGGTNGWVGQGSLYGTLTKREPS